MNDLISRKALLKELREIMDEPHGIVFLMGVGAAVSIIEHREIAFDKEKVIEELKKRKEDEKRYYSEFGDQDSLRGMRCYERAIEIVEKGGIE